jgi:glucose-1-phosphate thymidylyltransferase
VDKSAVIENSVIIPPSFIGPQAVIRNSVVGPFVSVGEKTMIENSNIRNSIIQSGSRVKNKIIENSMVGNHAVISGHSEELSAGDYTTQT